MGIIINLFRNPVVNRVESAFNHYVDALKRVPEKTVMLGSLKIPREYYALNLSIEPNQKQSGKILELVIKKAIASLTDRNHQITHQQLISIMLESVFEVEWPNASPKLIVDFTQARISIFNRLTKHPLIEPDSSVDLGFIGQEIFNVVKDQDSDKQPFIKILEILNSSPLPLDLLENISQVLVARNILSVSQCGSVRNEDVIDCFVVALLYYMERHLQDRNQERLFPQKDHPLETIGQQILDTARQDQWSRFCSHYAAQKPHVLKVFAEILAAPFAAAKSPGKSSSENSIDYIFDQNAAAIFASIQELIESSYKDYLASIDEKLNRHFGS
jgi:hypothetical protein